ncbi:Uncharacterised protein [Legionella lansingensis]|uniref:Uncharacterized protein n=1 Tax=Legionella lansingensis TaxID=45067 RepID=A0A0W0VK55_9GAMM|nr:hypothetical protein [Legionella lansingensis]KTD20214.1 hypothetical protein Llan_1975 [Legionella lansingensis]SNV48318.1 Uncharacterised protein [Legionella lansingensis]
MKLERITALINKAGYAYIGEGRGIGQAEGKKVECFQKKGLYSSDVIQLVIMDEKKDEILPVFSVNVPITLRDAVYAIMNDHTLAAENSMQLFN